MENLESQLASFEARSPAKIKGLLKELVKLLSLAAPDFHIKQLLAMIKRILRDEDHHKQQEIVQFMNRITQARLLQFLNEPPAHASKEEALSTALEMHFSIQHFQLRPDFQLLCVESDKPAMEYYIHHQLSLSRMGNAFRQGGFSAKEHQFCGMNLLMVIDEMLQFEKDGDDEDILIIFPHLRLVMHTSWEHLEASLNPHFHPTQLYSQAHLLEGQGLFKHHELIIILLHILAASYETIVKELQALHALHQKIDSVISPVW